MKKALIVNASTLHKSSANPVFDSLWEFSFLKLLSYRPEQSGYLLRHKKSMSVQLQTLAMMPVMIRQFQSKRIQNLIQCYKLGRLASDKFLEALKDTAMPNLAKNLPTPYEILLIDAWTVRIQPFDAAYKKRLDHLIARIDSDPELCTIHLITNSNALDMQQLLIYLHAVRADVFTDRNINLISAEKSVVIGQYKGCDIRLDASFNHQKFKNPSEPGLNTASILTEVVAGLTNTGVDCDHITVISQWHRDLITAKNIKLASQNDKQFFGSVSTPGPCWFYGGLAIGAAIALAASARTSVCMALLSSVIHMINKYAHEFHPQINIATGMMAVGIFASTAFNVAVTALTTDTHFIDLTSN